MSEEGRCVTYLIGIRVGMVAATAAMASSLLLLDKRYPSKRAKDDVGTYLEVITGLTSSKPRVRKHGSREPEVAGRGVGGGGVA